MARPTIPPLSYRHMSERVQSIEQKQPDFSRDSALPDKCLNEKRPRTNVGARNHRGQMSKRATAADKCLIEKPLRTNVRARKPLRTNVQRRSAQETAADKCPRGKRPWTFVRSSNRCGQMPNRETTTDKCPSEKPLRTNVQKRSAQDTVADKCRTEKPSRTNVRARNRRGQMPNRETAVDKCLSEESPRTNVGERSAKESAAVTRDSFVARCRSSFAP